MRTNDQRGKVATSISMEPYPGSGKAHIQGSHPGVRVPMREIFLKSNSHNGNGSSSTSSFFAYDTSGPYTDPEVSVDIRKGLPPKCLPWILDREDVEHLSQSSSKYSKDREADPGLKSIRFTPLRKPLRAKPGANVSQMHYARKGIVTPEMEYVAIRENLQREQQSGPGSSKRLFHQHPGAAWGRRSRTRSHPSSSATRWPEAAPSFLRTSIIQKSNRWLSGVTSWSRSTLISETPPSLLL